MSRLRKFSDTSTADTLVSLSTLSTCSHTCHTPPVTCHLHQSDVTVKPVSCDHPPRSLLAAAADPRNVGFQEDTACHRILSSHRRVVATQDNSLMFIVTLKGCHHHQRLTLSMKLRNHKLMKYPPRPPHTNQCLSVSAVSGQYHA
jgi:hypothetical protein